MAGRKMIKMEHNQSEKGFTLIESLISMVITTVGLLAVAGMIGIGIRLQTESRDATAANAFARAKIEEIQNYAPTASQRARGGSVTSDETNYNDTPDSRFKRRWLIETNPADAGVPAGTQRVTISVIANQAGLRLPPVTLTLLMPAP
jgi:prepilin-type N-terminal cleavage/methylation domain-containing protein